VKVSLIAAVAANGVIGADNRLPWRLPADLARFKTLTWGKPILMGRKTHESIGRPLPGRLNIVLSRNPAYRAAACCVVKDYAQALSMAHGAEELMVIGGASLYQDFLDVADRMYLTVIEKNFQGDAYFPSYEVDDWTEVEHLKMRGDESVDFDYFFKVMERKAASDLGVSREPARVL